MLSGIQQSDGSGGPDGSRSDGAEAGPSTAQPLLSEAVLARMKQRRASIQEEKKLDSGRKRNSIDLGSFGKGLVVETF